MGYEISWHKRGAYKKFHGHVTPSEFLESALAIQCHPEFDRFKFTINDFLGVETYSLDVEDVKETAVYGIGARVSNPKLFLGVVATNPAIIELAKKWYAPMTKYEISVFSTFDETNQWIQQTLGFSLD